MALIQIQVQPTQILAFGQDRLNINEPELVKNASLYLRASKGEQNWHREVHTRGDVECTHVSIWHIHI